MQTLRLPPMLSAAATVLCLVVPLLLSAQGSLPFNVTPPAPYAVPVVQPDGTTLQIIARGNQFQHWSETTDGYTVVKSKSGYYEYAKEQNGRLTGSGIVARNPQQRTLPAQRAMLSLTKHASPVASALQIQQLRQQLSPFRNARTQAEGTMPAKGKIRVLAICVDYPDYPSSISTNSFLGMFNGPSDKPTFRQYFLNNSYGQLDISVDVVGWIRAKKGYENYGHDIDGYASAKGLVAEAIEGAEKQGVDFSKYDNNNDGKVDGVIIIHSGPGAEEGGRTEYIWSHRWSMKSLYFDDRFISDYTIQPETRYGGKVGIGIFCHEFGHLLGLPDLYDTDLSNGKSSGIGEWGLMGTGGWLGEEASPAGMTAWSKEALGWADVNDITGQYGSYSVKAAGQHNEFYKIRTPNSNEYFLLENRQLAGVDAQLNGSGLAIWHIDSEKTALYPTYNEVNADHRRKGVDLEEADGRDDLDKGANRGDFGDLFPGLSGATSFNHESRPSTDLYIAARGSVKTGIGIEDIKEIRDQIEFTYRNDKAGVGETCAEPATATVGNNTSDQYTSWHAFTMPKDGGITLTSTGDNGKVTVYNSCGESAVAQSSTPNLSLGYLSKGQKILIKWEFSDSPALPLTWKLGVENMVTDTDSLALVAIYQQMGGSQWSKKANWLSGQVASWEGVKIENGRVTELRLDKVGLKNSFPADLYKLNALKKLVIKEGSLTGGLGEELTKLTELQELVVEADGLTIGFWSKINQLAKLKKLILTSVTIDQAIPAAIGQLSQLEELRLANTQVKGSLPESLGNSNALTHIDLSGNQLRGALPASLFNLPNLVYLALNDNQLETLPGNVLSSPKLRECYLQNNRLKGALPRDVNRGGTTPLTLALQNNQFTGSVPEAWESVIFDELTLNNNQLTGEFPAMGMPKRLDISANNFTALPALEKSSFTRGQTCVLICHTNHLTFDDLLPNQEYLSCSNCQNRYAPQEEVRINLDRNLKSGETSTIELPFDQAVSGSQYVWYREDKEVTRTKGNALTINSFTAEQAGGYRCDITNDALPGLTLRVRGISLNFQEKQQQTIEVPDVATKKFGDAPFTLSARSSAGLPLEYQKVEGPIALEDNRVTIQGSGEATVKIVSRGNDEYAAAEREITFTINRAKPVIRAGQVNDKSFGDEPFQLEVSADDNLSVSLTVEEGDVELDNRLVRILGAGDVRIRATREEDKDYEAANPVTIAFSVSRADQTLTFEPISDTTFLPDRTLELEADLSSDLEIHYEVVSGGVEIVDGKAIMKQAGSVTIRATQPGDDNYRPAIAVERSFTIAKADQEIYFEKIDDKKDTDAPFALQANSNSDLPISYRILRGDATVDSDGILTIGGDGEVVVEAYQEGNANYHEAQPVQQKFLVSAASKETQTIIVKNVPDTVVVGESLTLDITVSSNLPSEVLVAGPATNDSGTLTFTQPGEVQLQVAQPGNTAYNAAATYNKTIIVVTARINEPLAQNLIYGSTERVFGDQVEITASSGLPLALEVLEGPAEVTPEGRIRMNGVGRVRIKTTQAGNEQYEAIEETIAFEVAPASQAITFETTTLTDSTVLLQATTESGLPVVYSVQSGQAVISGDTLYAQASGSIVITATQEGDENYLAADPQSKTFDIQLITAVGEDPVADVVGIYPNPSPGIFQVRLAQQVGLANYRVINTQGQQLLEGTMRASESTLDLSLLAAGTYVLHLQTRRGSSHYRLIKQ